MPKKRSENRLYAERIAINRQGYDRRGKYWGVGLPLYRVTTGDGFLDIHVRAENAKKAKEVAARTYRPATGTVRRNPNFHFPRTNRGRPKKSRQWNLGFYGVDKKPIGKTTISTSRDDAKAAAMGYVGAKRDGKVIHKVVLTGPK